MGIVCRSQSVVKVRAMDTCLDGNNKRVSSGEANGTLKEIVVLYGLS